MDLLPDNILGKVSEDINSSPKIQFKQSASLILAIEKLYEHMRPNVLVTEEKKIIPDRKLEFNEIRQIINENATPKKDINSIFNVQPELQLKRDDDKKKSIIRQIESILENINKTAADGGHPQLLIRNQRLWTNCIYDANRVALKSSTNAKKTTITFSTTDNKSRFNAVVFVLTKIHELLTKNFTVTRRELFYQNVVRFRNQTNLDVAIRDVCCLLECPPWELGLIATAKGLIAGPLYIETRDGKIVDCMVSGGTMIPQDIIGIKSFKSQAKYILVVEKDAVFQKLLDEGALLRLGPLIIMTGKGYPDVCTRQLLVRLCLELKLQALALVDADPHGYEIFLTYKFGSLAQSHLSASLACPSLALIGARFTDIMTLAPEGARLTLTELDKRKINSLLKRPYLNTNSGIQLCVELREMLRSGVKAEIEALAPTAAALCDAYLPAKLIQGDFIR